MASTTLDLPIFTWTTPEGGSAHCRLRRFDTDHGPVVLLSELATNPGPSITNDAEGVIEAASAWLHLQPEQAIWIEHYDAMSYPNPLHTERYARIRVRRDREPTWEDLSPKAVEDLLGRTLVA